MLSVLQKLIEVQSSVVAACMGEQHGGTAIEGGSHGSRGLEEIPTYEHVKYKNSSICRDYGPIEDVWKGPLCCLSCRN